MMIINNGIETFPAISSPLWKKIHSPSEVLQSDHILHCLSQCEKFAHREFKILRPGLELFKITQFLC